MSNDEGAVRKQVDRVVAITTNLADELESDGSSEGTAACVALRKCVMEITGGDFHGVDQLSTLMHPKGIGGNFPIDRRDVHELLDLLDSLRKWWHRQENQ